MDASDQVVFLLKAVLYIAPVAVYFLALGLANSQARPVLVNARADFQLLTLVFVPLLVWPIPYLVAYGQWWGLAAGVMLAAGGFWRLLPGSTSGWVLYNVSGEDGWRMLEQAVAEMGWSARRSGHRLEVPQAGIRIEVASFALLRNMSFQVVSSGSPVTEEQFDRLRRGLQRQVNRQSLLPSTAGGCLMLLGASLMIVPLWLMSRHIQAIVEIVQQLLFA
jgi:hypothetical protein